MSKRNDYKANKLKEQQEQKVIGAILDKYFQEQGYQVIKQEITEDKELQSKGIDRIVYLTDDQEQYYVYVDDKAQHYFILKLNMIIYLFHIVESILMDI